MRKALKLQFFSMGTLKKLCKWLNDSPTARRLLINIPIIFLQNSCKNLLIKTTFE